ncbi:MAG: type II toxin-antitoxin system RelE/ParE family toxin [Candidatus Margulisbacteria bacterium]|jgi:putative addiction module killer protein|nr:type II toxin-antitoxin system RelE/ParE family toxin [Candidatus Margulisiibacteriota bacterium]
MSNRVETTEIFDKWFVKLKDINVKAIVRKNIDRMIKGNLGEARFVGDGVFEKKIDYGAGYRLYFVNKNNSWIILLCGGDKSTQKRDIVKAKELKKRWSAC